MNFLKRRHSTTFETGPVLLEDAYFVFSTLSTVTALRSRTYQHVKYYVGTEDRGGFVTGGSSAIDRGRWQLHRNTAVDGMSI